VDEPSTLSFELNGQPTSVAVDRATPLLDILRSHLGQLGPKEGCRVGYCGACTVLLDGAAIHSCCVLGVQVENRAVETIASTAADVEAVREAFMAQNAVQCGACIPGMIMSSVAALRACSGASEAEAQVTYDHLLGNICRCGGYSRIRAAVASVFEARGS
jgi:aerobic-type carbon monoxide dehydrogenase small subunit (CoxS/CutS family)